MSFHTSKAAILARNISRQLGLNTKIAKWILGSKYEQSYDEAFSSNILPGDVVWDIGANIGYYTAAFADRVGRDGNVVAFEPSELNRSRLHQATDQLPQVKCFPYAIGRTDTTVFFEQGDDDLGATSRVVKDRGTAVQMRSVKSLLINDGLPFPNTVKIDVEGFELDVLEGFEGILLSPSIRAIGIEVHFRLLQERGDAKAPAKIERKLQDAGFEIKWVDPSHILAKRSK
jgi:FkbM family methyltransferase